MSEGRDSIPPFEYKPTGFEKFIGQNECERIQRALYNAIYDPSTCPHCGAVKRYEGRPACDSMPFDPAPFSQPKDTGNE